MEEKKVDRKMREKRVNLKRLEKMTDVELLERKKNSPLKIQKKREQYEKAHAANMERLKRYVEYRKQDDEACLKVIEKRKQEASKPKAAEVKKTG